MPHKPLAASPDFYTPETREDLYADVIRELDWSAGELLDVLEELEILDRTIVIFMSDNGASYGGNNLPLKGKKATNWEGGVRVPFMIRYPGKIPSGSLVKTPGWSPDLFPTLLSMCGIEMPGDLYIDGEDITGVLRGEKQTHKAIYTMRGSTIRTIRKDQWKLYIENPRFYDPPDLENWVDKRAPDGLTIIAPYEQATPAQYPGIKPLDMEGETFLFNLEKDIAEMKNVAGENPKIVSALMEEYLQFMNSLEAE
jgi:uncharacterized sulfatase